MYVWMDLAREVVFSKWALSDFGVDKTIQI